MSPDILAYYLAEAMIVIVPLVCGIVIGLIWRGPPVRSRR